MCERIDVIDVSDVRVRVIVGTRTKLERQGEVVDGE